MQRNILFSKGLNKSNSILEFSCLKELYEYVNNIHTSKVKAFFFDLDNMLMIPSQSLGSDQWFEGHLNRVKNRNIDFKQALEQTLSIYHDVHNVSSVELLDEHAPELFSNLRNDGIKIFGLTTRGKTIVSPTLRQLSEINLSFDSLHEFDRDFILDLTEVGNESCLHKGIIFCGGVNKGKTLQHALAHCRKNDCFEHILFIDDKERNVRQVEEYVECEFSGFRFSKADVLVENICHKITDLQIKHFKEHGELISDDNARSKLLSDTPDIEECHKPKLSIS